LTAPYNRYTIGEPVLLTGTWTSPAGALFDPSNASVDVVDPSGRSTTYTYLNAQVQKSSTGIYTYTVDTTAKSGRWQYRWWSPGPTGQAAQNDQFFVDPFPSPTP
jgi:hypothetical protein